VAVVDKASKNLV